MIDRSAQLAQDVASGLSRRGFLGRLNRAAGGVAAAMAGLLTARPVEAGAGKKGKGPKPRLCCRYYGGWGEMFAQCTHPKTCPDYSADGWTLVDAYEVDDCEGCY
jgi:hypothetical protein